MKTKLLIPALFSLILIFVGCNDEILPEAESVPTLKSATAKIKIAVLSDIHYMDHSLLPAVPSENPAFQQLLFSGFNKMVEMSEPIFLQAVKELKVEKPDVLLVPGDLAFNGELVNHQFVETKLQEMADAGTQVLVIPGNNDINSPDALSFTGTGSTPVANISPADFVSIYGDFGYSDALYRDVNSLSYIFKIRDDLWVLGIDACIYSPAYSRKGNISSNTMTWIQEKMTEANKNGVTVLAMMHHGITEHYQNQSTLFSGDVVKNYTWVTTSLLESGIKFVFTGHSHANDIVEVVAGEKSIFDISTGSPITPSSPYRIVTIDDNFIKVQTKRITSIDPAMLPDGGSFIAYSNIYLSDHLDMFFKYYLVNVFKLPNDLVDASLPYVRNSLMAQFAGNERLLPNEARKIESVNELYPDNMVVPIIKNLWNDYPPDDNKIDIKLK